MGMRRNIALDYGAKEIAVEGQKEPVKVEQKIYLYTHWGAEGLENVLAQSLDRARERWGDDCYLGRIIASDMFKDAEQDITGYGLAPFVMDDEFPTLEVDLEAQTVNKVPFEDFIKNPQMFAI
jgi:hypothetical protein